MQLLALTAWDPARPWWTATVGRGRGDLEVVGSFLRGVTGEDARAHLDDLVRIYRLGLTRPLPMPPKTACTYAEKRRDGKNPDIAIGLAQRNWIAKRKDGTVFPALVTDAGIYRNGTLVGIVGVTTNLGSALRPLLERSTDAALVLRSDAVVTYASPAVKQLFGWEDSIVGTSVVPLLHPDERPALAQFMDEVVAQPGAHPALEIRVLSEESWVWAEAALTNMLDDPDVRGVVCNLRRSLRREAHETAELRVEQLNTALQSRVIIEQAKGFLAARYDLEPDQAFQRLRSYSRNHHLVIREVARRVVARELDLPQ